MKTAEALQAIDCIYNGTNCLPPQEALKVHKQVNEILESFTKERAIEFGKWIVEEGDMIYAEEWYDEFINE